MVGAAAESFILELPDRVVEKLNVLGKPVLPALKNWQIKTVTDSPTKVFDAIDAKRHRERRERYEAYWTAFPHQIRTTRNDAEPVNDIETPMAA